MGRDLQLYLIETIAVARDVDFAEGRALFRLRPLGHWCWLFDKTLRALVHDESPQA